MRLRLLAAAVLATLGSLVVPTVAQARSSSPTYYVSLGDSYSVGYQPGIGATPGYAAYVAARTRLKLANFGCGGATTSSILHTVGCPDVLPHTAGAMRYPTTTQIAAADAFLSAHRGHVGLITVSIGGNDVTACATAANPIGCVATAVTSIDTNVTYLVALLRSAAGPSVPIIGSTYPDVVLGTYVYPTHPASLTAVNLAKLSVTAFEDLINPALKRSYASGNGAFVDVTAATGAYGSLDAMVHTRAYGTIPVPVAKVCTYTWFCQKGDIHPHTSGYLVIGKLIVAKYRALVR